MRNGRIAKMYNFETNEHYKFDGIKQDQVTNTNESVGTSNCPMADRFNGTIDYGLDAWCCAMLPCDWFIPPPSCSAICRQVTLSQN
jgi:hypothetical protein